MNPQLSQVFQDFMQLIIWLVVARAVVGMVPIRPMTPLHPIKEAIIRTTERLVAPFRRFVPSNTMMDFSPMAAIVAIILVRATVMSATAAA